MADNISITGIGIVATDDISSVHYQRVKVQHGADGSATDVSTASPLPVSDAGGSLTVDGPLTDTELRAVAVPVSVATIPSHAVTNAGTFVVQENGAALTSLQLIDDVVKTEDLAHSSGDKGVMTLAVRQDSLAALAGATLDYSPLSVDAAGALYVNVDTIDILPAAPSAAAYIPVRLTDGSAFATGGTEYDEGATDAVITGTAVMWEDTANTLRAASAAKPFPVEIIAGASAGTEYLEAATDATIAGPVMMWEDTSDTIRAVSAAKPLPVNIISGAGSGGTAIVDDAAFTVAVTSLTPVGGMFDDAAPDSVNEGDAGVFRMSATRSLYVNIRDNAGNERGLNIDASGQLAVTGAVTVTGVVNTVPVTSGGLSIHRSLDLDETEEDVKTSAGQVYGVWFTNQATSTRWLKFYNATAANVTVGTTTPVITIGLPGNATDEISGSLFGGEGIAFGTAITVAVTTGVADADTGAPSANDVIINVFYK